LRRLTRTAGPDRHPGSPSSCAALPRSSAYMAYSSKSPVATRVTSCHAHELPPLPVKVSTRRNPLADEELGRRPKTEKKSTRHNSNATKAVSTHRMKKKCRHGAGLMLPRPCRRVSISALFACVRSSPRSAPFRSLQPSADHGPRTTGALGNGEVAGTLRRAVRGPRHDGECLLL
jgi:hypothetical protein